MPFLKKQINLLIVEDCSIIADAYKIILESMTKTSFIISFATNCDEAITHIHNKTFQLVLLDLQLPVSKSNRYLNGEDLGLLIRKASPNTKIIILTNVSDSLRITNIVNNLNPEGFAMKSEIDTKDLKHVVDLVLKSKNFKSKTIEFYANKLNFKGIKIDNFDRQILYHLSMGEKTKDISKFVPFSHRTIEVRKSKLKSLLIPESNTNTNLIKEAKKFGII
ncbi:response regulator [Yeosuana marina]|uniref:response regulator n=1 Tax=Yeosuana marina TaxID=1565536 RepID=UPI001421F748|nr:response regulator [Yeosuana marina]